MKTEKESITTDGKIIYKGYLIRQIFQYTSGTGDFEVFPDEGQEPGRMYPYTTLEEIKINIDEQTDFMLLSFNS